LQIRRDAALVSSVLFTIAFACLTPAELSNALTGQRNAGLLGSGFAEVAKLLSDLGVASLAIIFIGLIVTWAGYVHRVRWTWFVMSIIVWVWAFPLMILPLLRHSMALTWGEWASRAIKGPGPARDAAEEVLIFSVMVIALFLPAISFFQPSASQRRSEQ